MEIRVRTAYCLLAIGSSAVLLTCGRPNVPDARRDTTDQATGASAALQFGTLPSGALGTMELAGVPAESAIVLLVDSALLAGRVPSSLNVWTLRDYARLDSSAARYLATHPERAHWVQTTLSFVSCDGVVVNDRLLPPLHQRGILVDLFPARTRTRRTRARRAEHGPGVVEQRRRAHAFAAGPRQYCAVRARVHSAVAYGRWQAELRASDVGVSATCRLSGERLPVTYPLPAYTTVWGDARLDFFALYTYYGHHTQPCSAEWSSEGEHPLARALRAVAPREMAGFPGRTNVADGWRAKTLLPPLAW